MSVILSGYRIYSNGLQEIQPSLHKRKRLINTINAYSFVKAESDASFKSALNDSDVLIPDGFPIVWAVRLLNGVRIKKIAGEDLFFQMMTGLEQIKGTAFFLGSTNNTLSRIHQRISVEYPNVKVKYLSPPFKKEFDQKDLENMVAEINHFEPDVLFVGLTAPKQEKLASLLRSDLVCGDICSIGAVFDFYAGNIHRPGSFWIKMNLEWFVRLLKEPGRLWKRYLVYSPLFFIYVLREWFKKQ